MPTIYDIDFNLQADNLNHPNRRKTKFSAFLHSLVYPLQRLHDFFFDYYVAGGTYTDFNVLTTYNFGDRVIWDDKCIYEASYVDTTGIPQSFNGIYPNNTAFWIKVNDTFIGVDERVKYNSQKLLFEYALNRFFRVAALPADQIYITNNFIDAGVNFLMNTSSIESSLMPLNSVYQIHYMGLMPTYQTSVYDYTIFVPDAVYTALGSTANDREYAIRNFADKYNLAGMQYDVQSYV